MLRNLISRNLSKAACVISRKASSVSNLPASAKVFLARIPGKSVVTDSHAELLEGYSNVYSCFYIPYFHKKHVNTSIAMGIWAPKIDGINVEIAFVIPAKKCNVKVDPIPASKMKSEVN